MKRRPSLWGQGGRRNQPDPLDDAIRDAVLRMEFLLASEPHILKELDYA